MDLSVAAVGVNKGLNHTPRADEALPMAGVSWNS